ncbi:hypothetical protein K438DRAFT_2017792 [Mycena galopus ATCC 62051]|nr:hypothetical protein K438DRAFT_2017792 [Mycena galopus ATCC 62051]
MLSAQALVFASSRVLTPTRAPHLILRIPGWHWQSCTTTHAAHVDLSPSATQARGSAFSHPGTTCSVAPLRTAVAAYECESSGGVPRRRSSSHLGLFSYAHDVSQPSSSLFPCWGAEYEPVLGDVQSIALVADAFRAACEDIQPLFRCSCPGTCVLQCISPRPTRLSDLPTSPSYQPFSPTSVHPRVLQPPSAQPLALALALSLVETLAPPPRLAASAYPHAALPPTPPGHQQRQTPAPALTLGLPGRRPARERTAQRRPTRFARWCVRPRLAPHPLATRSGHHLYPSSRSSQLLALKLATHPLFQRLDLRPVLGVECGALWIDGSGTRALRPPCNDESTALSSEVRLTQATSASKWIARTSHSALLSSSVPSCTLTSPTHRSSPAPAHPVHRSPIRRPAFPPPRVSERAERSYTPRLSRCY